MPPRHLDTSVGGRRDCSLTAPDPNFRSRRFDVWKMTNEQAAPGFNRSRQGTGPVGLRGNLRHATRVRRPREPYRLRRQARECAAPQANEHSSALALQHCRKLVNRRRARTGVAGQVRNVLIGPCATISLKRARPTGNCSTKYANDSQKSPLSLRAYQSPKSPTGLATSRCRVSRKHSASGKA